MIPFTPTYLQPCKYFGFVYVSTISDHIYGNIFSKTIRGY